MELLNKKLEELKITTDKYDRFKILNQIRQLRYRLKQTNEQHEEHNQTMRDYRKKQKEEFDKIKANREKVKNDAIQTIQRIAKSRVARIVNEKKDEPKDNKKSKKVVHQPQKLEDIQELIQEEVVSKTKTRGRPKKLPTDIKPKNLEKSNATIDGYIKKIQTIHEWITNKPLLDGVVLQIKKLYNNEKFTQAGLTSNMPYLKNPNIIINIIPKTYKDNTIKSYLIPVSVILGKLKGFNKQYQQITGLAIEKNKNYVEIREKNVLQDKDTGKIIENFNDDKVMLENVDKIKSKKDKVIYVFAMRLQRRLEIRSLKLANSNTDFDDITNYLVVDENNNPIHCIFQDFKTMKNTPDIEPIPENLKSIVKDYLDSSKIKIGQYVLGQQQDKRLVIDQANFSTKVKTIFKNIYGAEISNNWVRQSFSTAFGEDNLEIVKKLEQDAKRAGHSVSEHIRYMRFSKKGT